MGRRQTVFIGFGSNQGSRKKQIEQALHALFQVHGVDLKGISSLYQTEPVGGPSQPDHLNGVVKMSVTLSPKKLLGELKRIERSLGRRPGAPKWGPRPIDLDILTWGNQRIHHRKLHIPHPLYYRRRFVLIPFCEIAPHFIHPEKKVPNGTLLRQLTPLGQRVTMLARWKKDRFYLSKRRKKSANP